MDDLSGSQSARGSLLNMDHVFVTERERENEPEKVYVSAGKKIGCWNSSGILN